MTVGEIYDVICGDKLLNVNKYDDDEGYLEQVYSSILDEPLPDHLRDKTVTFIDVIDGGLIVEYNAFEDRGESNEH